MSTRRGENVTIICTIILATAAFAAPYCVTLCLKRRNAPKLDIEFKNEKPYCHHAKTVTGSRPYYCHFVVHK